MHATANWCIAVCVYCMNSKYTELHFIAAEFAPISICPWLWFPAFTGDPCVYHTYGKREKGTVLVLYYSNYWACIYDVVQLA